MSPFLVPGSILMISIGTAALTFLTLFPSTYLDLVFFVQSNDVTLRHFQKHESICVIKRKGINLFSPSLYETILTRFLRTLSDAR
jgi:hypothetical protein